MLIIQIASTLSITCLFPILHIHKIDKDWTIHKPHTESIRMTLTGWIYRLANHIGFIKIHICK